MGFFYVVFSFCVSATGYEDHCQKEKLIDTQYLGLVSCYTGARKISGSFFTKSFYNLAHEVVVTQNFLFLASEFLDAPKFRDTYQHLGGGVSNQSSRTRRHPFHCWLIRGDFHAIQIQACPVE
ncbi:hypothetical protein [Pseudomonas syringae group genomosp. 3]|uniref:Secreted protein n=1 Tax=Pseudomonas syringae pv. persicae TaxID=237306 RepID=A0AB38ED41_9PSED|nr:hypothetical protein [Pseudomonas syringae group genomosp. 3]SOQ09174.1 hypothetical protein NCPPB2254_02215 [Pseudomonas syringae pv. persicae]SOQ09231.1 hypothetical protein CFBP1573P_02389 [Pseudomonas syringae pv. persicae]